MLSGTDETSSELRVQRGGCPCGRDHPGPGLRRPPRMRKSEDGLPVAAYQAFIAGRAVKDQQGRWWLCYSGSCTQPLTMSCHNAEGRLTAKRLVRCRRCQECLHARRYYWAMAALNQTRIAQANGNRTWFGTLTLDREGQAEMLARARLASSSPNADYWEDAACDARFQAVRTELMLECRRYWARLRKAGHTFKYLLVFERHKSGLPHMHFLLHEGNGPILKRDLESQWPWGFSKPMLVGGRSQQSVPPEKAAWYVAKYLAKDYQSRQIASQGYQPEKRANRHSKANAARDHVEPAPNENEEGTPRPHCTNEGNPPNENEEGWKFQNL